MKKISFMIIGLLVLSGCSRYASNGESLYLKSRNGEKINVPSPLTSSNISSFYDLPAQNQDARVSIEPPTE